MAKTTEKEPMDLEGIIAKLNKDFGAGTVINSNSEDKGKYDVIPTGSIGIDYIALGIGGFAKGRIYEIRGWEGSNKTTICGHLAASAQGMNMKVLYIDSEHSLDALYMSNLGVDMDDILISQPDYGEQGFETALRIIRSGDIGLVIIDSDSALLPKSCMEGDIGEARIGKKARLNSDFYPKLKVAVKNYHVCCVVISQYREKIGLMFGDSRTTQGGHALKYVADTIIDLTKSLKKEDDETSGTITTFKTLKNKTYTPFKVYKFDTIFGVGIDFVAETIKAAIEFDIITKEGNTYYYNSVKLGVGEGRMEQFISDNPELLKEIEEKIKEKLK